LLSQCCQVTVTVVTWIYRYRVVEVVNF
jgi:hypothetical protein